MQQQWQTFNGRVSRQLTETYDTNILAMLMLPMISDCQERHEQADRKSKECYLVPERRRLLELGIAGDHPERLARSS